MGYWAAQDRAIVCATWFGKDGAAITAAIALAQSSMPCKAVRVPCGVYSVAATINIPDGMLLFGDGLEATILVPTMTDGSPCIKVAAGASFWGVQDLAIVHELNTTNFVAGTTSPLNCIGIDAFQPAANYHTHYHMDNVRVHGVATGIKLRGFIGTLTNVHARYCGLGFSGALLNAVSANLRFEHCRQSFAISESSGLHFDNLLDEGVLTGAIASTLDNVDGVTFTSPYWESGTTYPRSEPFAVFGGTTEVTGVRILGARISGAEGMDWGVAPLKIDRCRGFYIDGSVEVGAQFRSLETTSNSRGLENYLISHGTGALQDNSKNVGPVVNFFPNPHFDAWFRGWSNVVHGNVTVARETSIRRRGENALRINAAAGANFNYCGFLVDGEPVTALRGKTVRAGVWVWVPDIVEYDEEQGHPSKPSITLSSYNGSATVISATANHHTAKGAWNYLVAEVSMQSDATRFDVNVYANQQSTNATGNEYLIIDEITVVEATCSEERQMNGDFRDSLALPGFVQGRMVYFAASVPTDAQQTYGVGDQVWRPDAAASASPGWVCTTAGAGGSAVFKAMANLAG